MSYDIDNRFDCVVINLMGDGTEEQKLTNSEKRCINGLTRGRGKFISP